RLGIAAGVAALAFAPLALTLAYAWRFGSGLPESPWFGNALGGVDSRYFVPPDVVWTASFWTERLNLILLACPTLPLLLPALVGPLRLRSSWTTAMLLAGFLGSFAMALFYNTK